MLDSFLRADKIKTRILEILNVIACIWIFILMLVIAVDVVGRGLFNTPLNGTTELVSNSILAITFMEIPYVLYRGNHVRSTMLTSRLKPEIQYYLEQLAILIGISMMVFLIISSWPAFITAIKIGEYEGEGSLRVPTYPTRGIIVLGSTMMIVEYCFQFIKKILIKKSKINESYILKGDE